MPVAPKRAAKQRALYRARQFLRALLASGRPLGEAEQKEVRAVLSASVWPLFAAMSRADQRHSLNVMHALQQDERSEASHADAVLQAALLHDCAKHAGGVQLWHRVAVVLLKVFWPGFLKRWGARPAPARGSWRYPFWAYVNHPSLGSHLAAHADCPPLTVRLIRHHQGRYDPAAEDAPSDDEWLAMLSALQAADDEN